MWEWTAGRVIWQVHVACCVRNLTLVEEVCGVGLLGVGLLGASRGL